MKRLALVSLVSLMLLVACKDGFATLPYIGETPKDVALAKKVYEMGDGLVVFVKVNSAIMQVAVTPEMYGMMFNNRVQGNQYMRGWQKMVARHFGKSGIGTVWLWSSHEKMAEAKKPMFSDRVKVKWFDDV